MVENIDFRLRVIEDQIGKVLDQNEKKAKGFGDTLKIAVGSFAGGAAIKAVEFLGSSIGELTGFLFSSIDAAAESEQAIKSLEIALASTGQLSEETSLAFQNLASEIQKTTAFEDDAVISSAALLQSLARLDSDGLQRATKAAVDLSAAIGIDLESASRLLGKAADGSTAAIGKLGIDFKKGGSEGETFSNILGEIEKRFGGAAQKQAQTFSGSIAQIKNTFGDLKEEIGKVITQNHAVAAVFATLRDVFIKASEAIKKSIEGVSADAFANFVRLVLDGAAIINLALDVTIRSLGLLADTAIISFQALNLGVQTVIAGMLNLASSVPVIGESFSVAASEANDKMIRLAESVDQSFESIKSTFTKETGLSGLTQEIADARVQFDVLFSEISANKDALKNTGTTGGVGLTEEELDRQRVLGAELIDLQNQFAIQSEELASQRDIVASERVTGKNAENIAVLASFEQSKIELALQAEISKNEGIKNQQERALANQKSYEKASVASAKIRADEERKIDALRISQRDDFLSTASSLANSENKTLAAIGKAAALAQIAIKTPPAVASAFEYGSFIGGPPVGFAFAGVAAAAMAQQAAQVVGIKGFAGGGIVGATSGSDNRIATVRDGEMILNASQQKTLFDSINNGPLGGGDIIIKIDEREIARAVRSQSQKGFRFA